MKTFFLAIAIILSPATIPGCEELAKQIPTSKSSALTNQEIVEGLKTALLVGTDSSVHTTSRINGFYLDEAIKIMLPPEANIIYDHKNNILFRTTGLDKKIEDAVLALNRAAEDAAKMAGPIFKNSIQNLSITEGLTILRGRNPLVPAGESAFDSTAATNYLRTSTYNELVIAFSPVVNSSLDKKLVGNLSPNQIWNSLSTSYNSVALKSFGMIEPMKTTDLGAYVTEKALEGLFLKVAEEEIKIRNNPVQWARTAVGNILQRVFGNQMS